jgi:hypothetical protein
MMMLVNMPGPGQKKGFSSDLFFLIVTLIPWVVMIWLLLPRR